MPPGIWRARYAGHPAESLWVEGNGFLPMTGGTLALAQTGALVSGQGPSLFLTGDNTLMLLFLSFLSVLLAMAFWLGGLFYALTTPAQDVAVDRFYPTVFASWGLVLMGVLSIFFLGPFTAGFFLKENSHAAWYGFIIVLAIAWAILQAAAFGLGLSLMRNAGLGRTHIKALLASSLACIGASVIGVLTFGWIMSLMGIS